MYRISAFAFKSLLLYFRFIRKIFAVYYYEMALVKECEVTVLVDKKTLRFRNVLANGRFVFFLFS